MDGVPLGMVRSLAVTLLYPLTMLIALAIGSAHAFQLAPPQVIPKSDWGVDPLIHSFSALKSTEYSVLGATSCSSTACHGGPSAGVSSVDVVRGSEYPLWIESDPHARSWQTLNSKKSLEILSRLNVIVEGVVINPTAYQNCLACHNTTIELGSDRISPKIAEGVGCEACHGPSEGGAISITKVSKASGLPSIVWVWLKLSRS